MIKKRPAKHIRTYLDSSGVRYRRKKKKTFALIGISCIALLSLYGTVSMLRAESFQYHTLQIEGNALIPDYEIKGIVTSVIERDTHLFGLVPHTSTFFIDDSAIEKELLTHIRRIKSVSVESHLQGTVDVQVTERGSLAKWCNSEACFDLDVYGYIFGESSQVAGRAPSQQPESETSNVSGISRTEQQVSEGQPTTSAQTPTAVQRAQSASAQDAIDVAMNQSSSGASQEEGAKKTRTLPQIDPATEAMRMYGAETYIFKGLIEDAPIGKQFLSEESLAYIIEFLSFLRSKGKQISYIQCDSVQHCDIVLHTGAKIIVDVSEDLRLMTDRFEVALENPALARDAYEYVDLRYGNKIFFKITGKEETLTNQTEQKKSPQTAPAPSRASESRASARTQSVPSTPSVSSPSPTASTEAQ
jgi:cell division septal protein FtsQ